MPDWPSQLPQPIFFDDFSSDTRSNYTYHRGASSGLAVSGGKLVPAALTEKLIYPTSLAARTGSVMLFEVTPGSGTGHQYHGVAPKITGANDFLVAYIDSDDSQLKMSRVVSSAFTNLSFFSITGFSRTTNYYLLSLLLADAWEVALFTTDPEANGASATRVGQAGASLTSTAFSASVTGRQGVRINNLDDNNAVFDNLKVWTPDACPVNLLAALNA